MYMRYAEWVHSLRKKILQAIKAISLASCNCERYVTHMGTKWGLNKRDLLSFDGVVIFFRSKITWRDRRRRALEAEKWLFSFVFETRICSDASVIALGVSDIGYLFSLKSNEFLKKIYLKCMHFFHVWRSTEVLRNIFMQNKRCHGLLRLKYVYGTSSSGSSSHFLKYQVNLKQFVHGMPNVACWSCWDFTIWQRQSWKQTYTGKLDTRSLLAMVSWPENAFQR